MGGVPNSLREIGDTAFERSRMRAQLKLEELQKEAHSSKAAEQHLRELFKIKSGEEIAQIPLTEMAKEYLMLPAKRRRGAL